MKQTAVKWLQEQLIPEYGNFPDAIVKLFNQAKEMEKGQRCYSEEEVRLAYQKGEEDSYLKGGQTKEMENEFIQSLQQKHEPNKSE